MKRILVSGHRGAAGLEPENTLRSFRRACDLGVDFVEMDVHLTHDGHVVCIHDTFVDRTTQSSGLVREMTLEQLRRLDAGLGESPPTLQEAIAVVRGRAVLEIELKGAGTVKPVLKILGEAGIGPDETLLIAFDLDRLKEVRYHRPDLPVSPLYSYPPSDMVQEAVRLGAGSISMNCGRVNPRMVEDTHAAGLLFRTWTADTREEMERLISYGVDSITTNHPDILLALLRTTKA